VLLVGVGQGSNTTYHVAEELLPGSYKLTEPVEGTVVLDGVETRVVSKLHYWDTQADFSPLEPELEARGKLRRGSVGDAASTLLEAGPFVELALERLKEDPTRFWTSWSEEALARARGAGGP
jgi:aminoglycoside 3-N-acetyltransferase